MCSNKTHYLIRRVAGIFVLLSLALGTWVSPWFYLFTAFVGLNLLQSSFSRWCPIEGLFEKKTRATVGGAGSGSSAVAPGPGAARGAERPGGAAPSPLTDEA